ncbi:hypothetical protein AB0395_19745 [Streptosporangium sp. NPDC051023]|uniref:hypothetical protein n=1 Tax=Streptosporangium sp. NPDC051023 TaxID=3155410 RepID=UPI00344D551D
MAVNAARRAHPLKIAGLVLGLMIVALLGTAFWLCEALADAQAAADDREAAMRAAGTHALDLLSVGHKTVDADIRRILDTSTGEAKAEYARTVTTLKETTVKNKVLQTGALRASGLVSLKGRIAKVMVVGDAVIRWEGSKQIPQERFYQWNMEVTKVGTAWLVSKAELVL